MSDPKNPELFKDFTLSQEEPEKQKTREEEMKELLTDEQKKREQLRMEQIEKIKDDKDRQQLLLKVAAKDKINADQLDAVKQKQQDEINKEVNKKVNEQGNPILAMTGLSGKSPKAIHDQVAARYKAHHQYEREVCAQNTHDVSRVTIDKDIDKAMQQELAREQIQKIRARNREPEEVFEKPAQEEARDAFRGATESKSWREVRAERQQEDNERKL